jgi:hypothetical protein
MAAKLCPVRSIGSGQPENKQPPLLSPKQIQIVKRLSSYKAHRMGNHPEKQPPEEQSENDLPVWPHKFEDIRK